MHRGLLVAGVERLSLAEEIWNQRETLRQMKYGKLILQLSYFLFYQLRVLGRRAEEPRGLL